MSATDEKTFAFTCAACGRVQRAKTDRQPKGWKLFERAGLHCPACAAASSMTLAVSLPVRDVSDLAGETLTGEGRPVYECFREAWDMATRLANWCVHQLVLHDARPDEGDDGLATYDPKMFPGGLSLYQHWTLNYPNRDLWDGAAGSAAEIIAQTENTWKRHKSFGRFACLYLGKASPMHHRWPYPWLVRAQEMRGGATGASVKNLWMASGHPHARIPIPGGPVVCRLACGKEWRRQVSRFEQLISGEGRLGAAKLCGRFSGGRLVGAMLRVSGDFPCAAPKVGVVAQVSTGPDALLTAAVPGRDEPYQEFADELRGLMIAYDRWRARAATDLKFEKRWPAKTRARIVQGCRPRVERMAERIKTQTQQAIARLVAWLKRQNVCGVVYADGEVGYLPRLDRTALREAMKCKCRQEGLSFQLATEEDDVS